MAPKPQQKANQQHIGVGVEPLLANSSSSSSSSAPSVDDLIYNNDNNVYANAGNRNSDVFSGLPQQQSEEIGSQPVVPADTSYMSALRKPDRIQLTEAPFQAAFNIISIAMLFAALGSFRISADEENSDSTADESTPYLQTLAWYLAAVVAAYGPEIIHSIVMFLAIDEKMTDQINMESDFVGAMGKTVVKSNKDTPFYNVTVGTGVASAISVAGTFASFVRGYYAYGAIGLALTGPLLKATTKFKQSDKEAKTKRDQNRLIGVEAFIAGLTHPGTWQPGTFAKKILPFLDPNEEHSHMTKNFARYLLDNLFGGIAKTQGYKECILKQNSFYNTNSEQTTYSTVQKNTNPQDQACLLELFIIAGYTVGISEQNLKGMFKKAEAGDAGAKKSDNYLWTKLVAFGQSLNLILNAYGKEDEYKRLASDRPMDDGKLKSALEITGLLKLARYTGINKLAASDVADFLSIDAAKLAATFAASAFQAEGTDQGIYFEEEMRTATAFYALVMISFSPIFLELGLSMFENFEVTLNRTMVREIAGRGRDIENALPVAMDADAVNARFLHKVGFASLVASFGLLQGAGALILNNEIIYASLVFAVSAYLGKSGNKSLQDAERIAFQTPEMNNVIGKQLAEALDKRDGTFAKIITKNLTEYGINSAITKEFAVNALESIFSNQAKEGEAVLANKNYAQSDVVALKALFTIVKMGGAAPKFEDESVKAPMTNKLNNDNRNNNNNGGGTPGVDADADADGCCSKLFNFGQ